MEYFGRARIAPQGLTRVLTSLAFNAALPERRSRIFRKILSPFPFSESLATFSLNCVIEIRGVTGSAS